MGTLSRIGVSLDLKLLHQFDSYIADQDYENRSEAFRDLIRDRLVGSVVVSANALVAGTVTLIYDHHTRLLPEKLTDLQHESQWIVISTLQAHLYHANCLEVVVLRGRSQEVQKLADRKSFTFARNCYLLRPFFDVREWCTNADAREMVHGPHGFQS
jgi:CopG family nickel-responsive transcriptional regulator